MRRSSGIGIALVVLALGLPGCSEDVLDGVGPSVSTTVVTDSLTFDDMLEIDIDTAAGDIEVVAVDSQTATVTRTFRYSGDDAPEATAEVRGSARTLELYHDCSGFEQCSVSYRVESPALMTLDLASASGSLAVTGMELPVKADTASGSITLTDLSGEATASTASGSITGTGLAVVRLYADTASGSIRLTFVAEPEAVTAESSSGSVRVFVPGGPYDVEADSTSGSVDIDIATDPASDRIIRVSSTSGSVEVGPA
jgi:DUF4097 and DUF4098 domain-containing protein YvlB